MNLKKVNFRIVPSEHPAYKVLTKVMEWHGELRDASIALAWRIRNKADKDGHIVLGKCVKIVDLHKEFMPYDFVIVLNNECWEEFSESQRLALVDHELCHAALDLDEKGEPKEDVKGRKVYRMRKHDIEEFHEIVERHGCYKEDLERFAKAVRNKHQAPLFDGNETREVRPN